MTCCLNYDYVKLFQQQRHHYLAGNYYLKLLSAIIVKLFQQQRRHYLPDNDYLVAICHNAIATSTVTT